MALHTGQPCFFCKKILEESDDVVVCPDCGTPYHRACYQQNQRCINTELHETGVSYEPIGLKPAEAVSSQIPCPNCGKPNEPGSSYCTACGKALGQPLQNPSWEKPSQEDDADPAQEGSLRSRMEQAAGEMGLHDPYCGMDQEKTLDGERLGDVADFVERNTIYYLPRFQRFQVSGHKLSLNIPCLFVPQLYFANRKMWLVAIVLTAIFSLLNLPQTALSLQEMLPDMIASFQNTAENPFAAMYPNMPELLQGMLERLDNGETAIYNASVICSGLKICMSFLLGLFGNAIYYRYVLRRVHQIRGENLSDAARQTKLRMQGGTNGWLILGMLGLGYVLELVITMILFAVLLV